MCAWGPSKRARTHSEAIEKLFVSVILSRFGGATKELQATVAQPVHASPSEGCGVVERGRVHSAAVAAAAAGRRARFGASSSWSKV